MMICEVGLNHMGSVSYANEFVDKIIKAKSDGIIFHIRTEGYYQQKRNKKLVLPDEFYLNVAKKLKANKVKYGIATDEPDKINFCEEVGVDFYKIFSKDIKNTEIIHKIIKTKKNTFAATGMSNISEIEKFVKLIKNHKKKFTLVHTQLDNDIRVVNLKAIPILKTKFGMNVGYGNHAANSKVLYLALAYEPSDLLFYVKGNRVKKHVDDKHAINLSEIKYLISDFRELPNAIGNGKKIKMGWRIK